MFALAGFAQELAKAREKIVWNKVSALNSNRHFYIYLSLLGAAISARSRESVCKRLSTAVAAIESEPVNREFGTQFQVLSILHRDGIHLNH